MQTDSSGPDSDGNASITHSIPGFTLEGLLGQGGMGLVYRASQHRPRRPVALKLLRPSAISQRAIRRFEREAEILARLQHPSIARVYEAGVVEAGTDIADRPTPYFAMELIDGEALGRYAEANGLTTKDRVRLFISICDATHYAHEQGVIHRDLKPANILVDQAGRPKVLDFGIARVTESDLTLTTMQTDVGQLLGTLAYMSPEQVVGDPASIDARSDVYALGVTLYELLCGQLPYNISPNSLPEAARIIQEEDPSPLSTHDRAMRGDLEMIVGRCLEKEPHRRYASAEALAQDLRRHLASQPIEARPPSGWYQATRFAKRNKTLVVGLAAVFVTLVLGMMGTSLGLSQAVDAQRREAEERAEAQKQRRQAEDAANQAKFNERVMAQALAEEQQMRALAQQQSEIADNTSKLYQNMIRSARPEIAQGKDLTLLLLILERGVQLANEQLSDHPQEQGHLRRELADSFISLGMFERGQEQLEQAYTLSAKASGPSSPHTLRCLTMLADLHRIQGEHLNSSEINKRNAATSRRVEGIESERFMYDYHNLSTNYYNLDSLEKANAIIDYLIPLAETNPELRPHHLNTLRNAKAVHLLQAGQYKQAHTILNNVYQDRRQTLGLLDLDTLTSVYNLSWAMIKKGAPSEAVNLINDILPEITESYKDEPREINKLRSVLASAYHQSGRDDLAIPIFKELISSYTDIFGTKHPNTLGAYYDMAECLRLSERYEEARKAYLISYLGSKENYGPAHPHTLNAQLHLGESMAGLGQYAKAEEHIQTYVNIASAQWGEESISTLIGRHILAQCVYNSGDHARAERLAQALYEKTSDLFGNDHVYVARFATVYARALLANGRAERAEFILLEALEVLPSHQAVQSYDRVLAARTLASVYVKLGLVDQAEYWYGQADELLESIRGTGFNQ